MGGGGVRGAAHLGVLARLRAAGIRPDVLVGTSAGAIAAALDGAGVTAAEAVQRLQATPPQAVFRPTFGRGRLFSVAYAVLFELMGVDRRRRRALPKAIFRSQPIVAWLEELLPESSFASLQRPTYAACVDLVRKRPVLLGPAPPPPLPEGCEYLADLPLATAVAASGAIPFLIEPIAHGAHRLADGALSDPVPVRYLRALGCRIVLAVDLSAGERDARGQPTEDLVWGLKRSFQVSQEHLLREQLTDADLVIRPRLPAVALHRFDLVPQFVVAGQKAAERALPRLEALLDHA